MHRAWRDRRKMLYGGWPTSSTMSFVSNSCARPQKVGIEHHSRWRASSLETPPGVPLPPCAASIVKRWSVFCKGKIPSVLAFLQTLLYAAVKGLLARSDPSPKRFFKGRGSITHGMRNELYLRSRTGVRASFIALTLAEVSESISSRQTEGKLS